MAVAKSLDELAATFDTEAEELSALEVATAQRDALSVSLTALVKYLRKVDGFMPNVVQWQLRDAEALLVEVKG